MGGVEKLSLGRAGVVGVVAVAAGVAAGHLVAGVVGVGASPVVAVGAWVVDLSPGWLTEIGKSVGPEWDKRLLFLGMAAVLVGLGVVAGALSRRAVGPGVGVAVALGVVVGAAVWGRGDLGQLAILVPVVATVVGAGVFRWLHRLARRAGTDEGRRAFLIGSGGVVVGAGVAALGGQVVGGRVDVEASRRAVGAVMAGRRISVPAADFAADGTPSFITPNSRFYRIDTALTVPRIRAEDWRLRIHGLVDDELELGFADITRMGLVDKVVTMTCVSNEVGGDLVSTAVFTGVPLRDLLARAGVRPEAGQVFATSADGWTTATPVADVLSAERGALLAVGMNGDALPIEHGFPARVVVPGLYGYVSATKWVVDLELIRDGAKTFYWQDRGWAKEAPIKTQSRIDAPRPFQTVPAGRVVIAGVAWAQTVGVERVEVRVDGGRWQRAELAAEVTDQAWRMWRVAVEVAPGEHRAEVRATDAAGRTQAEERVPPIPDGATGWHSVLFTAS
ncbi:molybdopterin-dependent oxidoreductase [Actinokineospora sp. NPDC004072]